MASAEERRRQFRRQAMEHHPDRGGDPGRFREAVEAYRAAMSAPASPNPAPAGRHRADVRAHKTATPTERLVRTLVKRIARRRRYATL